MGIHWLAICVAAIVLAVIVGGCGTTSSTEVDGAEAGMSTSQPLTVDRHRSDGTTFDPCTAFSANDLVRWGVGATPYGHAGTPDQPARGCQWNAPACAVERNGICWSLTVTVANQAIGDYVDQGAREQTVAGRAGAVDTDGAQTCYMMLPVERATVSVAITSDDPAVVDPCGKAEALATDVVGYLPAPS